MAEDFIIEDMSKASKNTPAPEVGRDHAAMKKEAFDRYDPTNKAYSVYLGSTDTAPLLSDDVLEALSVSPQSDVEQTKRIINIVRNYVNKNDIVGVTVESIENNVNSKVRLQWQNGHSKGMQKSQLDVAKEIIAEFNEQIGLERLIPNLVCSVYTEGTYIMCLRKKTGRGAGARPTYVVDHYPLGVAQVSTYDVGGEPYVIIDINELKSRLQKNYQRNRKNKPLFFGSLAEEIEATYPPEVYKAYAAKERYAKLDICYSAVIRINNQNKQYGLSPVFRALFPSLMLETFAKADSMNAKVRAKKIVAQVMNKEIAGVDFEKDYAEEQALAHENFMAAWKQRVVVATLPPSVRDVKYVEPKGEMTNIDTVNHYRTMAMSTLGIAFLADSNSQSLSVANISVKQLMKMINKITRQFDAVLQKWYRVVLQDNAVDPSYAPKPVVVDAEMMESTLTLDLARFLYTTMNSSMETVYDMLGMSLQDERAKREQENANGLNDVFAPRLTSFTASGGDASPTPQTGRKPAADADNPDKQAYDKNRAASQKE